MRTAPICPLDGRLRMRCAVFCAGARACDFAAQRRGPVSYASVTQLNGLLAQLEATSKTTQADLVKLRIERWKTDAASKKQALGNVDSIQRNLQERCRRCIGQLRTAPEDLPATFKLYRNLDALYDVLGSVVEVDGSVWIEGRSSGAVERSE